MGMVMAEDVGGLQAVTEHEGLVGKQLGRWAFGDDGAGAQQDGAGAKFDDELEVVGGDDLGDGDVAKQVDELAATARVQAAGGFVEDEDGRIAGQDAGQARSAFLAGA